MSWLIRLEGDELVESLRWKSWLERFSQGIEVVDVETSLEELVGHRVDISRIPVAGDDDNGIIQGNCRTTLVRILVSTVAHLVKSRRW